MKDHEIVSEIRRVIEIESASIRQLLDTLNENTITEVVKLIADCKGRVIISGCGTSAMAAKKVAHSLCCIERPALFLSPSDAVHGALGVVQENDILILISKGGNTQELVPILHAAITKKAKTIAVTENPDSLIGKDASLVLEVKVDREPCRFNMLATASTLAVISTFDAICIALMSYMGYTREQFAVIHPGGAVGARLLSKRKDEEK